MRVVVDSNILISALITTGGVPDVLYQLWQAKRFSLVTSTFQINELRDVTRRPQLKSMFEPHSAGRLINALRRNAVVLDALPEVSYSPDPKDNPILATAIAGQAQYVVSGDKRDMVRLEKVQGIPVVTARDFVSRFVKLEP